MQAEITLHHGFTTGVIIDSDIRMVFIDIFFFKKMCINARSSVVLVIFNFCKSL